MQLFIKNMVCDRCRLVVKTVLEEQRLQPKNILLGEITLEEDELTDEQRASLSNALEKVGFELINDRKGRLIEGIKTFVIDMVHHAEEPPSINYSSLLSRHLHHDYSYLSNLFSSVEGITIEHYIISQKIEKVKELLVYEEMSLSDIAFQLGYSSTAHLSTQFKKLTGFTPSQFRKMERKGRTSLDKIGKKN